MITYEKKQQHTYVRRATRKSHFKLNLAFKVIQGHSSLLV